MNTPILFIIFNRPNTTQEVFNTIRKIKPQKLFIAADGPRRSRLGEKELCEKTRQLVLQNIDWDCEVRTLFREENLGCKKAVSEAITWFFTHIESGIILEDDCLPNESFFGFCEELLEKYKDEEKIFMVSGNNFLPNSLKIQESYYFSKIAHIWGWATWRRAWNKYDISMEDFPKFIKENKIEEIWSNKKTQKYWLEKFEEVYSNKLNTWDYQWVYTIWKNDGVSIAPNVNLVSNIGFGVGGTNTLNIDSDFSNLPTEEILFPLKNKNTDIYIAGDKYENINLHLKNYTIKKILKNIGLFKIIKYIYVILEKK